MIGIVVSGDAGHELDDEDRPSRRRCLQAQIQVATVGMLGRIEIPADVVDSDEAHMDAADGRRKLRARYPNALHLGWTATPCRLDGRGLSKEYDDIVVVASPSDLIALGHIVEPRVFTVPKEILPDLANVKRISGDFEHAELSKRVRRRAIVGGIVDNWQRLADGRSTVAFSVTREHSKQIVRSFRDAKIEAVHIDGENAPAERRAILAAYERGDIQILSCCELLSTGWNSPRTKCVIQARPTLSLPLHLQQTGRSMRPWGNVGALILDHAGNAMRRGLGLPTEERDWQGIFRTETRPTPAKSSTRECSGCHMVVAARTDACSHCGVVHERTPPAVGPELTSILEEVGASGKVDNSAEERRAAWSAIQQVASDIGADMTWATRIFDARFNESQACIN
jgi:superfamily II DNA or RNA helicase